MSCCEELAGQIAALSGKLNNLASKSDLENLAARLANLEAYVNSLRNNFSNNQNQNQDNSNNNTGTVAQQAAGMVLASPLLLGMINNGPGIRDAVLGGKEGAQAAREALARVAQLESNVVKVTQPLAANAARLAKVEGLLARMMPLLGLVNVVGTILALAEGYAANEIQGQRNDANERYADRLSYEISKLYTLITPMKRQLDKLGGDMATLNSFKLDITDVSNRLTSYYEKLYPKANDALYAANKANEKIGNIQPVLEKAAKQANDGLYAANKANEKIADLIQRITDDETRLDTAYQKANDGLYAGNRANEKIAEVINRIIADEDRLDTAYQRGNDALYEVRALPAKVNSQITVLENRVLVNERNFDSVRASATEARQMANDALYAGNRANQKIQVINEQSLVNQAVNAAVNAVNSSSSLSSATQQQQQQISQVKSKVDQGLDELWQQITQIQNTQVTGTSSSTAQNNRIDTYYGQVQELQQKISQQSLSVQNLNNTVLSIQTSVTNGVQIANSGLNAQIQAQIGQLQGQITQLKVLTPSTNTDAFNAQVQGQITQLRSQVTEIAQTKTADTTSDAYKKQVQSQIDQLQGQIGGLTAKPTLTPTEVNQLREQLKNPLNPVKQQDVDQMKDTLKRIEAFQPLIPGLIIPAIAATPIKVGEFSGPAKADLENAATTGVCRSTQPGGCMRKTIDPIENAVNRNGDLLQRNGSLLDKINAGLSGLNTGLITGMNNTVNAINGKLGPAIPGGIGTVLQNLANGFNSFVKWSQIDRLLGILNLWVSMHNAYMLSSNLMQTLFSTMDTVLSAFGLAMKDTEGHDIGIGQLVGNSFEAMMRQVFGIEEWKLIKAEVAAANRIYQSAINVVYSVTSILDATRNILEVVGSYVGKIGNALKKSGAVLEKSYSWMHTDLTAMTATSAKWEKLYQDIQNTETVVSSIGMVAGDVVSIKDTVKSMKDTRKSIEEDIKKVETGKGLVESEGKLNSEAPVNLTSAVIGQRDADKENP